MIKVKGDVYMKVTNHKQVEDTYMTKGVVSQILSQVQMKDVMYKHTPGRAVLKAIMSGFFIGIMTVFMLVVKTQLTGLNEGGRKLDWCDFIQLSAGINRINECRIADE